MRTVNDTLNNARDAIKATVDYLGSLVKNDGTDDAHPSRTHHTDLCQVLDEIGWSNTVETPPVDTRTSPI